MTMTKLEMEMAVFVVLVFALDVYDGCDGGTCLILLLTNPVTLGLYEGAQEEPFRDVCRDQI
jgi:hypothetical protein